MWKIAVLLLGLFYIVSVIVDLVRNRRVAKHGTAVDRVMLPFFREEIQERYTPGWVRVVATCACAFLLIPGCALLCWDLIAYLIDRRAWASGCVLLYACVGLVLTVRDINRGIRGSVGIVGTLLGGAILWPLWLYIQWRSGHGAQ